MNSTTDMATRRETGMELPRPLSSTPFVLIDDAREEGVAMLFTQPAAIIRADSVAALPEALAALEVALAQGLIAAGYIAYESGAMFESRWPRRAEIEWPYLWFGLFTDGQVLADIELPDAGEAMFGPLRPLISQAEHRTAVERVLELIQAGDIYQANVTFPAQISWSGDPLALYARIRASSRAGYGGIVDLGDRALLSASPELFFEVDEGRVVARPMKGTVPRSGDHAIDALRSEGLRASAKERAENLMITDLLRNDLSRVAVAGSVVTPLLFSVETYPTVLQMTSTVEAKLRDGLGPLDLLRAAFPCGSVTGAPKLRAAEVIAEVEIEPRGPYTGAIGWMTRDAARFNVVIRTLELIPDRPARIGLGSGIVADSDPASEWAECLAKAAFLA